MTTYPFILTGILAGWLLGWLAWMAAQYYVAGYVEPGVERQPLWPVHAQTGAVIGMAALAQGLMALWGGYVAWQTPSLPGLAVALIPTAILLAISLVDSQVHRIPNTMVAMLFAWAAVQIIWLGQPTPISALLGMVAGGALFLILYLISRRMLGAGDVKFAVAIGALFGFPLALYALTFGIMFGGLGALLLMATRRVGRKDYIAYGPYLALGAWVILVSSLSLFPPN